MVGRAGSDGREDRRWCWRGQVVVAVGGGKAGGGGGESMVAMELMMAGRR
jgi:hypothetical protein